MVAEAITYDEIDTAKGSVRSIVPMPQDSGTSSIPVDEQVEDNKNRENDVVTKLSAKGTAMESVWEFFKKYFLEGQEIDEKYQVNENSSFLERNRQYFALGIPFVIVQTVWWSLMFSQDWFYLFNEPFGDYDKPRFWIAVTMIFGSMVAGATAEGGAAIAFPVMTLALGIDPVVARDFSLMIQSIGMTSAAFTILYMRVKIDMNALKYVTFSGIFGTIFGLEVIAPRLTPAYAKMYFVCIWSSFAVGLAILNMNVDRHLYDRIPHFKGGIIWKYNDRIVFNWKVVALFGAGFVGGMCTAISGSGIDICTFSVLTLLFRVDEKVATPTSVVLMGINTVIGFLWVEFGQGGVEQEGWYSLACAAPVVVVGAPMGSFIGSHFHRLTLAVIIYILSVIKMVGALIIVQPWSFENTDTPVHLCITSAVLFFSGMIFFRILSIFGLRLMVTIDNLPSVVRNVSSVLDIQDFDGTKENSDSESIPSTGEGEVGLPISI